MQFTEAWDDTCSSVGRAAKMGNVQELKRLINLGYPVDVADNRGWRPLHEAASLSKDIRCLEELLKHEKTDPNWQTHEGETACLLTCKRRSGVDAIDAVKLLMRYGADVNLADNEGETPLLAAARSGSAQLIQVLLESTAINPNAGDCSGWRPLHEAASRGHTEMVHNLLQWGASVDVLDECGMTPIFTAAQHGRLECLQALVSHVIQKEQSCLVNQGAEDWATPLMIAAQQGFSDCVRYLLTNGATANLRTLDNVTALHLAVQGDHVECLNILLAHMDLSRLIADCHPVMSQQWGENADANPMEVPFHGDVINPLHLAVEWQSYRCLKLLLEAGFPVDSVLKSSQTTAFVLPFPTGHFETALSYAINKGDTEAMQILLDAGASCVPLSANMTSPLIAAILSPTMTELNILLNRGANVNYLRNGIKTSECLLVALRNIEALEKLLQHGANPKLCFSNGDESKQLFLQCLFIPIARQSHVIEVLTLFLKYLEPSLIYQMTVIEAATRSKEVYQTAYDNHSWNELIYKASILCPLSHLCRLAIRNHLASYHSFPLDRCILKLQLPVPITKFLCYDDC